MIAATNGLSHWRRQGQNYTLRDQMTGVIETHNDPEDRAALPSSRK
jgi:hypothetical protein